MGGPYNNGCEGGRGATSMQYLKDWGLTWAACQPYTSGTPPATPFASLFVEEASTTCRGQCVPAFQEAHPNREHEYFTGSNVSHL